MAPLSRRLVIGIPWTILLIDVIIRVFENISGSVVFVMDESQSSDSHLLLGGAIPTRKGSMPLDWLTNGQGALVSNCSEGLSLVHDQILSRTETHPVGRNIPRIIHQTSKTRCAAQPYVRLIRRWKAFPNYAYYLHDDDAVERLFAKNWEAFPQLRQIMRCVECPTIKADVWRYLVLWEYGGIYADLDSVPSKPFVNGSLITDEMDSFFVIEYYGLLSQYFIAASPRHPLMFYALQMTLNNLLDADNRHTVDAPFKTGPRLLHEAFSRLLQDSGLNPIRLHRVAAGSWTVANNRSITAIGVREKPDRYIARDAFTIEVKKNVLQEMGMTYYKETYDANVASSSVINASCLAHLYHVHRVERRIHD